MADVSDPGANGTDSKCSDDKNNETVRENCENVSDNSNTQPAESDSAADKADKINEANVQNSPNTRDDEPVKKAQEQKNGEKKGLSEKELSENSQYELVDGKYYFTDTQSGQRYVYDEDCGDWVASDEQQENQQQVKTDEEGRTYYYADNMYLCRDAEGNVFFMDKNSEWVPWGAETNPKIGNKEESSKWYFYQGDDTFYRDKVSDVVYKLNKDKNDWEVYEGKVRVKRARTDPDEEFDTDEEESDEEISCGSAPPGARYDPNIEYDGNMYTKRDPGDNMVYEWDMTRRAWFPKLDEDFMATYQLSYGFNPDGTKNENPLKFDDEIEDPADALREEEKKNEKLNQPKKKPTWFEMDDAQNTKVYVSNLPDSTTEEEFIELMSKCGMILKDPASNKYKIKMYRDSEGNFKGDALCSYIKRESVDLALQILDDYQVGNQKIHVELAKFQLKGEYNPKLKPPKKKKKELEKLQKKQEKLFDWRPEPMRGQRQKFERTVIIRNVFNPSEFENKVEKILTHKESMRNQCLNFGHINKLELYDLHSDGVVQVTFKEVEAADMCVATLNNRLYEGRTLRVATWDGKEKFKIEETEEQKEERLKKWNKFLETGSKNE